MYFSEHVALALILAGVVCYIVGKGLWPRVRLNRHEFQLSIDRQEILNDDQKTLPKD
jgi:hypothetical protein